MSVEGLLLSPDPLEFGNVTVGQSSALGVNLVPKDPTGASITSIVMVPGSDPAFTIQETLTVPPSFTNTPAYGDSTNLAQGESAGFSVTFAPTSTGLKTGLLQIAFNGPGEAYLVTLVVTGTGA